MLTSYLQSIVQCIKDQFRNTPGQALIDNERFALTDDEGGAIQRSSWATKVRPGAQINMSVVVPRSALGPGDCPKCYSHIPPQTRTWYG